MAFCCHGLKINFTLHWKYYLYHDNKHNTSNGRIVGDQQLYFNSLQEMPTSNPHEGSDTDLILQNPIWDSESHEILAKIPDSKQRF